MEQYYICSQKNLWAEEMGLFHPKNNKKNTQKSS